MIITSGSAMKTPHMPIRMKSSVLPAMERFSFLPPERRRIFFSSLMIFAGRLSTGLFLGTAVMSLTYPSEQALHQFIGAHHQQEEDGGDSGGIAHVQTR